MGDRARRHAALEERGVRDARRERRPWQLGHRRAGIPPKRVRLRGPVKVAKGAREAKKMMLRRVVVPPGDGPYEAALLAQLRDALVQLGDCLAELLLPRLMRRHFQLALHLGPREAERLELPRTFRIATLGDLPRPLLLFFAFFQAFGEAGLRVDEAFSGVTHRLLIIRVGRR